jgi:hypothetical protein
MVDHRLGHRPDLEDMWRNLGVALPSDVGHRNVGDSSPESSIHRDAAVLGGWGSVHLGLR